MAPGLYGDLPQAKNASEQAPAWGATPKLQPQPKKPAPLAPPPSLLRSGGRGGGRTPSAGRGRGSGLTSSAQEGGAADTNFTTTSSSISAPNSIFATVHDEYDPMRPNDYEQVLKERAQAKRDAEAEVERLAKVKEMEAAMEKLRQQEEPPDRSTTLNISGEDAYLRRGKMGSGGAGPAAAVGPSGAGLGSGGGDAGAGAGAGAGEASGDKGNKGMTLAQKMLMKMGWKEGEGLGRERQGISTPLVMQKTNARAGVIVNAEPNAASTAAAGQQRARSGAMIVGAPSRVLCLRNMVGPGEVDEELEDEVGMECTTKYGTVTSVMIFEITQPGYPPEEAVRIFVQFERQESAMKALVDLQGRFFGGREVRGAFFSEERFARVELAPVPGEFD